MKISVRGVLAGACLGMASVGFSSAAFAEQQLVTHLEGYNIVVDEEGNESFTEASEVKPGQVIEYRMFFQNQGEDAIRQWKPIGPVPLHTKYVADSANTDVRAELRVSVDGGANYEAEPVKRTRTLPDGTVEEYIIPPESYTHISWEVKERLSKDETEVFKYRVKVDSDQ